MATIFLSLINFYINSKNIILDFLVTKQKMKNFSSREIVAFIYFLVT